MTTQELDELKALLSKAEEGLIQQERKRIVEISNKGSSAEMRERAIKFSKPV